MQLSIHHTYYQKQFLNLINNESYSFFKSRFNSFNISAELDHSLTTVIFNLINKEISSLKEILPTLVQSLSRFQSEKNHLKKQYLSANHSGKLISSLLSEPLYFDYHFESNLKNYSNDYEFLYEKFLPSMDKLLAFIGVYEELYLINALSLSYGPVHTLNYDSGMFTFSTRTNSLTFKVIPIFFLTKFLFPTLKDVVSIQLILEKLLEIDFSGAKYLVTISDTEQISSFYQFCNMNYLGRFLSEKIRKGEEFNLPTLLTNSQLHV